MTVKNRILSLCLIASCVPCFTGCATVLSKREYPVAFENSGGNTYFAVRDRNHELVHQGVTPQEVTLPAKSSAFMPAKYSVTFAGANDTSQNRELKAGFDPWVVGNIALGGVIGTVVDGATGAMFKLPKKLTGEVPAQYAIADVEQGAKIAAASLPQSTSEMSALDVKQVEYLFATKPPETEPAVETAAGKQPAAIQPTALQAALQTANTNPAATNQTAPVQTATAR